MFAVCRHGYDIAESGGHRGLSKGVLAPSDGRAVGLERQDMVFASGDRCDSGQASRNGQCLGIPRRAKRGHRTVGTKDSDKGVAGGCSNGVGHEVQVRKITNNIRAPGNDRPVGLDCCREIVPRHDLYDVRQPCGNRRLPSVISTPSHDSAVGLEGEGMFLTCC